MPRKTPNKRTAGRPREREPLKNRSALGKTFAARLVELRHARGLTQAELSAKSGVMQRFISRVESGRAEAGLPTVEKLAKALGVSPLVMLS